MKIRFHFSFMAEFRQWGIDEWEDGAGLARISHQPPASPPVTLGYERHPFRLPLVGPPALLDAAALAALSQPDIEVRV